MNAKEVASLLQEGSHAGLFVCSTACRSCRVADARLSAVSWPAWQLCGSIVSCQFIAVARLGHPSDLLYHHLTCISFSVYVYCPVQYLRLQLGMSALLVWNSRALHTLRVPSMCHLAQSYSTLHMLGSPTTPLSWHPACMPIHVC